MKTRSRPLSLLIADDDGEDRHLMSEAFDTAKVPTSTVFVGDGIELLSSLRGEKEWAGKQVRPDIIILDLNMPRKDGRECLVELKNDPLLAAIPVIVLTTSSSPEDVALCYAAGASSYLTKPASFGGLIEHLDALCAYWSNVAILPSD